MKRSMTKRPLINGQTVLLCAVLAVYLYALVKIILFKGHFAEPAYLMQQLQISLQDPALILTRMKQGNLIPLHEITSALKAATSHSQVNVYGNIAIFVPFGLLLGWLGARKGKGAIGVVALAFALSLSLETAQALFSIGRFDVDDLILNTTGGFAGYLLSALFFKFGREKISGTDYDTDSGRRSGNRRPRRTAPDQTGLSLHQGEGRAGGVGRDSEASDSASHSRYYDAEARRLRGDPTNPGQTPYADHLFECEELRPR